MAVARHIANELRHHKTDLRQRPDSLTEEVGHQESAKSGHSAGKDKVRRHRPDSLTEEVGHQEGAKLDTKPEKTK